MGQESGDLVVETIIPTENDESIAKTEYELQREAEERVVTCLQSNHGNTFPLLALMRACTEARPFREVEDEMSSLSVMHMTHQSPHALADILINCGGLEKIVVEEKGVTSTSDKADGPDAQAGFANAGEGSKGSEGSDGEDGDSVYRENIANSESNDDAGDVCECSGDLSEDTDSDAEDKKTALEDQPVDYLLHITPAGLSALDDFDPLKRFERLIAGEPETYFDAYKQVLMLCESGMRFDDIESALAGHPSLKDPKQIFPGYFVSKLETVGGIAWEDNRWHITEQGRDMVSLL